MHIVVPIKLVPDLVEELNVNADGTDLDREFLSLKINEFDDHALEAALLLKEAAGGTVTVIAAESDETDKVLCTALAKGADRAVKITGLEPGTPTSVLARAVAGVLRTMDFDLVLTGVQAPDDRDGQLGVLLAARIGVAHLSVVSGVTVAGGTLTAHKEYAGGVTATFEISGRAVLGIQAAGQTPRYAPVSRVRQVMKEATIQEIEAGDAGDIATSVVRRVFKPEKGTRATMIEGSADEVADRIAKILKDKKG